MKSPFDNEKKHRGFPDELILFAGEYDSFEQVDQSKFYEVFRQLELFEDPFLNMQAMNLSLIDNYITDVERSLLQEFFASERTPTGPAMFVSAISQMWIFAFYELLRTWGSRIRKLERLASNGGLDSYIAQHSDEAPNISSLHAARNAERMKSEPTFSSTLKNQQKCLKFLYEVLSDIRVTLAKHEIPGKPNKPAFNPGYFRINAGCGAVDFYAMNKAGQQYRVNRRDLADLFRAVTF